MGNKRGDGRLLASELEILRSANRLTIVEVRRGRDSRARVNPPMTRRFKLD